MSMLLSSNSQNRATQFTPVWRLCSRTKTKLPVFSPSPSTRRVTASAGNAARADATRGERGRAVGSSQSANSFQLKFPACLFIRDSRARRPCQVHLLKSLESRLPAPLPEIRGRIVEGVAEFDQH